MKIKKDGIYKNIETKDFGIYQSLGWEKVVAEPTKILEEPKEKIVIDEPAPTIVHEVNVGEVKVVELPKSKKKKASK